MNKLKNVLILVLILVLCMSTMNFADDGTVVVTGTINATVVSFSVPAATTFVLNPNGLTAETSFISPDFIVGNTSTAPLAVSVSALEIDPTSTHIFTDVDPTVYTDDEWLKLTKTDAESKIALAVVAKNAGEWGTLLNADPIYAKTVQAGVVNVGVLNPGASATLLFSAKHGKAFSAPYVCKYRLVFTFTLA